MDYQDLVA